MEIIKMCKGWEHLFGKEQSLIALDVIGLDILGIDILEYFSIYVLIFVTGIVKTFQQLLMDELEPNGLSYVLAVFGHLLQVK